MLFTAPPWLGRLRTAFLIVIIARSIATAQGPTACEPPYDVGYRIVEFAEGSKAAFWYPTADQPTLTPYWEGGISGELARDGAPSTCGQFPLVLFSHGLDSCALLSISFTEELARQGYVVAAPDHRDASCSVDGQGAFKLTPSDEPLFEPGKWTEASHADRRDDLRTLLDFTLATDPFRQLVDPEAIGAAGHSLGGYTVLGVAGAWPSWRDDRIRAALALSPYVQPFQAKQTLSSIEAPVMFQGADLDVFITPFIDQDAFAAAPPPRYFVRLHWGTHLEWLSPVLCSDDKTIAACLGTNGNARLINAYGFAFLDRYLKGQESAILLEGGRGLSDYRRTVRLHVVPAASYDPESPVAVEAIASGFGEGLSESRANAQRLPLPEELLDLRVRIVDEAGATHEAPLFFTGPEQVNFFIPESAAEGRAQVEAVRDGEVIASGEVEIDQVAPSLFAADASGSGAAAGFYVLVAPDGSRSGGPITPGANGEPTPIDPGGPGHLLYLELFGTGLRRASSLSATVDGIEVPTTEPFPHPQWVGLDQVNLGPLPQELAGRGVVQVLLKADDKVANEVSIALR